MVISAIARLPSSGLSPVFQRPSSGLPALLLHLLQRDSSPKVRRPSTGNPLPLTTPSSPLHSSPPFVTTFLPSPLPSPAASRQPPSPLPPHFSSPDLKRCLSPAPSTIYLALLTTTLLRTTHCHPPTNQNHHPRTIPFSVDSPPKTAVTSFFCSNKQHHHHPHYPHSQSQSPIFCPILPSTRSNPDDFSDGPVIFLEINSVQDSISW